jgi:hypothetical protein
MIPTAASFFITKYRMPAPRHTCRLRAKGAPWTNRLLCKRSDVTQRLFLLVLTELGRRHFALSFGDHL